MLEQAGSQDKTRKITSPDPEHNYTATPETHNAIFGETVWT